LIGKLATNPRTAKHLADQAFVQKLQMIQSNPQLAEGLLSGDPRMIDILGVLMGIDMQGFSREEGSDELPPGVAKDARSSPTSPSSSSQPKPTPPPQASTSTPTPPAPAPAPAKIEEVEDVEMEDADEEEVKAKNSAEQEKKLGSEAYKRQDFESAVTHFSKAWEIWPKDVTFLTNLGGSFFFCVFFFRLVLLLFGY
jgi:STI1 domain